MQNLDQKFKLDREKFTHKQKMDKEKFSFEKEKTLKDQDLKLKQIQNRKVNK